MNYYDELGLSRAASTAEIQQAYRSLVKIIHPDQQQDPIRKRLADIQLRRWNDIAEILTDPDKRRAYDAGLVTSDSRERRKAVAAAEGPLRVRVTLKAHARVLAVLPILAVLVVAVIWFLKGPLLGYSKPPATAALTRPQTDQTAKPFLIVVPDEPASAHSAPEPSAPAPAPAAQPAPSLPSKPVLTAAKIPLVGQWRTAGPTRQSVELSLQALAGRLRGDVHAKSAVAAREIRFHFEGNPGARNALLPWSSPEGSRGEVRLKRVTDKQLELTWFTTDGPRDDFPETGTAVLLRASR